MNVFESVFMDVSGESFTEKNRLKIPSMDAQSSSRKKNSGVKKVFPCYVERW